MNFLKKFGGVLARIAGVGSQVAPLASAVAGAVASASGNQTVKSVAGEIGAIGGVITSIEGAFQAAQSDPSAKTGPDKLKAAVPLVGNIIRSSELLAGKAVANESAFEQAVSGITSSFADLLNALEVSPAK
jgi:hypothetical protein